jgi:uncharacterized protein YndB with AHSA1/START domain
MGSFQVETVIKRPIEQVFKYLSNITNTPRWYSAVTSAELLQGDGPALNSRYRIVRNLPQGEVEDIVKVIEYDAPNRFRFGTSEGSTPFDYSYTLESLEDSTKITLDAEINLGGVARILSPIATQAFKRGMQDNLKALAGILEL